MFPAERIWRARCPEAEPQVARMRGAQAAPRQSELCPIRRSPSSRQAERAVRLTEADRKNSFPRIATDPSGAVYLTYRTPMQGHGLGTASGPQPSPLDGNRWKGPITVPNSETTGRAPADGRDRPGDLMMIAVTDHRFSAGKAGGGGGQKKNE